MLPIKNKIQLKLICEIFYLRIRLNKISIFRIVLKRLKLHHSFNGVARIFSYTQAWVSEGEQEFENFSKKGCFLNFEWYKINFTTYGFPWKDFWKNPQVPP